MKSAPFSDVSVGASAETTRPGLAQRLLGRALSRFDCGRLVITLPSGATIDHRGTAHGPEADVTVQRWRAFWRMLWGGELGFARGFIDGDWVTQDLHAVLAFFQQNETAAAAPAKGGWVASALNRLRHGARANTRRGSRRNIIAHYDLGNAFYVQWLDRNMSYSSALYRSGQETLEDAQDAKLDRVIALLEADRGQSVLEIGCGWGGLAERLIKDHCCKVTGLTLSSEQLEYAQRRFAGQGPEEADLRLQDYRDVDGRYDRVVSIEMLEAVGERYWPVYFEKLRACLNTDGIAVLQVITIAEQRFAAYKSRPDFIQRYIFPGGMLPPKEAIEREAARAGLTLVSVETFGQSYARTLAEWRRRFNQAWPTIRDLGFDARFKRMWDYYLVYCQIGFEFAAVDVGLYKLVNSPDR